MRFELAKTVKSRKMQVEVRAGRGGGASGREGVMTMAQAKARPSTKRSQGRKRSPAPKKAQASPSRSSGHRGSNGKARVGAARKAVENSTKEAGQAVSKVASNAKTPLLAGSGACRSRRGAGDRHHAFPSIAFPQSAGAQDASGQAGQNQITRCRQGGEGGRDSQPACVRTRDGAATRSRNSNGDKRRSPMEVVLDGLTARH
jgi:hypothetical protein